MALGGQGLIYGPNLEQRFSVGRIAAAGLQSRSRLLIPSERTSGEQTGNKMSKTGPNLDAETPINPGILTSEERHFARWGPGGRRFKSCLPD